MTKIRSLVFALSVFLNSSLRGDPIWVSIWPSDTDPRIHAFNTPHWICVNREIVLGSSDQDRHELLLFIPGTFGHGQGAKRFLETAANLGYHCIELMYPDDTSASACDNDANPSAFEDFRLALIRGGKSPHISAETFDSIESRLQRLLVVLAQRRPREKWDQFMRGNEIAWERFALAGQSQGGGHAALMAVKHRVARVVMFGAPKDFSTRLRRPAAWYSETKATPVSCFFAINHQQDRQACTFPQQLENIRALGMYRLGEPVDVDRNKPPYLHSHILTTNYPGTAVNSTTAHGTAISDRNQAIFKETWVYMLTAPTE